MLFLQQGSGTKLEEAKQAAPVAIAEKAEAASETAASSAEAPAVTVAAPTAANPGGPAAQASMPASPYPVSAALAQLNANAQQPQMYYVQVPSGQIPAGQIPVGQPYVLQQQAAPGAMQPVVVGPGGAVAGQSGDTIVQEGPYQQVGGQYHNLPALKIGRNGLLSNPCVDPPSVHGAAYNRAY